jgi:hypothetical protein
MKYYNTIASSYTELHRTEQQLKFRAALTHTSVTGNAILDLGGRAYSSRLFLLRRYLLELISPQIW